MARSAHLLGRRGLRSPRAHVPDLDLQDRGRIDGALGGQLDPSSSARVSPAHRVWRSSRRQSDRLADRARGDVALLRARRGQDGRDRAPRHPAAAQEQQLESLLSRRQAHGLRKGLDELSGDQRRAPRRPQRVRSDRLLHAGLQVRRQVVDALHRDSQGRGHRPLRGAGQFNGPADRPRRCRAGDGRALRRRRGQPALPKSPRRLHGG